MLRDPRTRVYTLKLCILHIARTMSEVLLGTQSVMFAMEYADASIPQKFENSTLMNNCASEINFLLISEFVSKDIVCIDKYQLCTLHRRETMLVHMARH